MMPRPILFTTSARLPVMQPLTQPQANRIMAEHHAEAERRGLPAKPPRVRTIRENETIVYRLDYRAPRSH